MVYLRDLQQNQRHKETGQVRSCSGETNAEQTAVHKRQPRTLPPSQTGHGEQLLLQTATALPTEKPVQETFPAIVHHPEQQTCHL